MVGSDYPSQNTLIRAVIVVIVVIIMFSYYSRHT
jgi:preprotein translocase subunit SecE